MALSSLAWLWFHLRLRLTTFEILPTLTLWGHKKQNLRRIKKVFPLIAKFYSEDCIVAASWEVAVYSALLSYQIVIVAAPINVGSNTHI